MNEEKRIPLYIHDDYDPKKQEEWLRQKRKEREKEIKRGCEEVDFDINSEILIDEVLS